MIVYRKNESFILRNAFHSMETEISKEKIHISWIIGQVLIRKSFSREFEIFNQKYT